MLLGGTAAARRREWHRESPDGPVWAYSAPTWLIIC